MHVLKADHDGSVELAGVAGRVPRPVDIDQTATHFKALRTLRIYCFASPAVIEGHAEVDEVFLVVLAGAVDLVMRSKNWPDSGASFRLMAANDHAAMACAAYLPPHTEYRLTPLESAEVAYARATPAAARSPRILASAPRTEDGGAVVLWDEPTHAERLRCRLVQIEARHATAAVTPIRGDEAQSEALIHVRTTPARGAATMETDGQPTTPRESWDTIALAPGSYPTVRLSAGSSMVGLIVTAT